MFKRPNLFIVGAAKTGTSSLYYYLKSHPEIYMSPIKEPNYFFKEVKINPFTPKYIKEAYFNPQKYFWKNRLENKQVAYIKSLNNYIQLFREVKEEKIIGECSVSYLYSRYAAKEIYKFNPDAKIIIILRNPVDRAFSHWLMDVREGRNDLKTKFIDSVKEDYNKKQKGWGISHLYIELGQYYEQVKRYLNVFPLDQIKVYIFEKIIKNYSKFYRDVLNFLGVNSNFKISSFKKYNVAKIPKNKSVNIINNLVNRSYFFVESSTNLYFPFGLRFLYRKISTFFYTSKNIPSLAKNERVILMNEFFKKDILQLNELINNEASIWLDY